MPLLPLLALVLLLAGCADSRPSPPPTGVMHAAARLIPPAGEALEVTLLDIPPGRIVEAVTLIGPDGARYPAESLVPSTSEAGIAGPNPTIGIGVAGGSSSGIHPSVGIGWSLYGGEAGVRQSRRLSARFALTDPAAWRSQPEAWRLEVAFLEATGERRLQVLPLGRP